MTIGNFWEEPICLGKPIDQDALNKYPVGAFSNLDYRSKIHGLVSEYYNHGNPTCAFDFDRFFAATDSLLDVGNILYMAEVSEWPANETIGQLWMYGVLQALAIQRQATRQLLRCFGQKRLFYFEEEIRRINEIRVTVAGHPSNHNGKHLEVKGCTFLGHRAFGSRTSFTAVTYQDFKKTVHREINLPKLIGEQSIALQANLCAVWDKTNKIGKIASDLFREEYQ